MATIELTIMLKGPLHVGGGPASARNVVPFARDARGRPCIPATTLKGLHRAATEQVAIALGLKVCHSPVLSQMCHPINSETGCVVCRIFGSAWLPGKVFYRDPALTVPPLTETRIAAPQSRRRQVRIERHATRREIVPGSLTLTGRIDHLIHDPALLGLALAGLRAITAIGGHSATGYGLCTIEARANDSLKRPVDEASLAAALRQLLRETP
jgi:CRISPR/Cas system CSM-associated protein Csm3 (group 7 of RAMP superfamily)